MRTNSKWRKEENEKERRGGRRQIGMKFLSAVCILCFLAPVLSEIPVEAASKSLVLYEGDIADGTVTVPAGTYRNIRLDGSVKDAVLYLNDVTVTDTLTVSGTGKDSNMLNLTGSTTVNKVILEGNCVLSAPDNQVRITTISIRSGIEAVLKVRARNISITGGTDSAQVRLYREVNYLADRGKYTNLVAYAPILRFCSFGSYLTAELRGGGTEMNLDGVGNRLAFYAPAEQVKAGGVRNVVAVEENVKVRRVELTAPDVKVIRGERIEELVRSDPESSGKTDCRFLFIGDSYTERLHTQGYLAEGMESLCASGTSPKDWFLPGAKGLNYREKLADYRPEAVVYMYGINNMKVQSNVAFSKRLLKELMKQYPEVPIYVQRVFPLGSSYDMLEAYSYEDINHGGSCNVDRYNQEMEAFCLEYEALKWLDTTEGFLNGNGDLRNDKTDDGLHLNAAAYAEWWIRLSAALSLQG